MIPPSLPVQHDGGVHRLRQSPSRQAELRRLARHAAAADGLDVQQGRRPRHDLCALQGGAPSLRRPDDRPPAHAVRRADAAASRWSRRASSGRSRFRTSDALAGPARRADLARGWASPISPAIPGPASWRRRTRRSRSSTSSTPPSTTSCARPKPRRASPSSTSCSGQARRRNSPLSSPKETPVWIANGAGIRRHGAVANRRPGLRGRNSGSRNGSGIRRRRTQVLKLCQKVTVPPSFRPHAPAKPFKG